MIFSRKNAVFLSNIHSMLLNVYQIHNVLSYQHKFRPIRECYCISEILNKARTETVVECSTGRAHRKPMK